MNMRFCRLTIALLGCVASVSFMPDKGCAQLPPGLPFPPENYAATHAFGAPSAVDIEHFSLGGAGVADPTSAWQGNPAGVLAATKPELLTYQQRTGFDSLPNFHSSFFGYAQTVGDARKFAFKVSYIPVSSSGALAGTPLQASIKEDDPGLELGYRATEKLSFGAGFSYLSTRSDYSLPGVGVVTHLKSHPSKLGGRFGVIYQANKRLSLGATVDRYTETVEQSIPVLNTPTTSFRFNSKAYTIGLCWNPSPSQKFLLDYGNAQIEGANARLTQRYYHLGFEQKTKDWTFRIGSYDGKPTGGVGWRHGRYKVSYGFSNRYKENFTGRGAQTSHALQLITSF